MSSRPQLGEPRIIVAKASVLLIISKTLTAINVHTRWSCAIVFCIGTHVYITVNMYDMCNSISDCLACIYGQWSKVLERLQKIIIVEPFYAVERIFSWVSSHHLGFESCVNTEKLAIAVQIHGLASNVGFKAVSEQLP